MLLVEVWRYGLDWVTIKAPRASRNRHGWGKGKTLGKELNIPHMGLKHISKQKQGWGEGNKLNKGLCYLYTHLERIGVSGVWGRQEGKGFCLLPPLLTPLKYNSSTDCGLGNYRGVTTNAKNFDVFGWGLKSGLYFILHKMVVFFIFVLKIFSFSF